MPAPRPPSPDWLVPAPSEDRLARIQARSAQIPAADLARSIETLTQSRAAIGFADLIQDTRVAKISVVGVGMRSHAGVAATMFKTLGERGINIQAITTSEIKVSVLIEEDYTELAVRVLHTAYGLDADAPAE